MQQNEKNLRNMYHMDKIYRLKIVFSSNEIIQIHSDIYIFKTIINISMI